MRYLLCFIFPPLAVILSSGGIIATIVNVILSFTYFGGVIHAIVVVAEYRSKVRFRKEMAIERRKIAILATTK